MGKIAGFFPLPGSDSQFVVAEWHPDPEIIEAEMIKMADDFEDWTIPLQEAREVMIENTRILFQEERGPDGRRWVPLDEVYAIDKKKDGYGGKSILRREDHLYDTATSEEAWFVDQDAIYFNSAALPSYGPIHQDGTGKKGTSGFHRIMRTQTPEQINALAQRNPKIGRAIAHFESNEGSGNNLPARPFIGANEAAILKIENIFLAWIDRTIETPWRQPPIRVVEDLGINKLGVFPIIGYTKRGQPMLRTPHGVRFGKKS